MLQASQKIGLSQPATSEALGRLRAQLDDALWCRSAALWSLTPFARDLIEPVETLCADMEIVLRRTAFDPGHAVRTFWIVTVDYLAMQITKALGETLEVVAPNIHLQFVDLPWNAMDKLKSGQLDLVIGSTNMFDPADRASLNMQPLCEDCLVAMVGPNHRVAHAAQLTEEDRLGYREAIFHPGVEWEYYSERPLAMPPEGAAIMVQQFMLLPTIALQSRHIVIVPRSLAKDMIVILPLSMHEARGSTTLTDLNAFVPNVSIGSRAGQGTNQGGFAIRGIGGGRYLC